MAQHDYNLSNNTGALYRADNNAVLQAIVTVNSGATAPTVTFPGMLWLDLSGGGDGVVRRRNQANSAWLTDIGQDQVARDAAAAAQTTANNAMPKSGGTFTGAINLIAAVPTNNQAVSRTNADALYQVKLPTPVAGSLLYGTAGGWAAQLPPAANDTILALSGGLPTWMSTTTVAAPNTVIRTRPDGTIDPTLIPSVASGLRFRGTFKPEVNDEYPTTGGSGPVGAPAVGDFWVIDGLTTGGYTYLTGSLAGVTVYNGDSIAKSETDWYRMGSSVQLDGYMRVDGSTAMTGDLNMGDNMLVDVGGIAARAGTPVPLNNFSIDATNVVVSPQRGTTGPDLAVMAAGQIGTDIGRMQLFVGAGASNTGLLPVRFFSATEAYAIGDYVRNGGKVYRARVAVSAGAFVASQWAPVIDDDTPTFTTNPWIQNALPPSLYWRHTGNVADQQRAHLYVENVTGDFMCAVVNDAGSVLNAGFRVSRADGAFTPNTGPSSTLTLGSVNNPWNGLFSRGYIRLINTVDARVTTDTLPGANTARLMLTSSGSAGAGQGAYIALYGNEYGTAALQGNIGLNAGLNGAGTIALAGTVSVNGQFYHQMASPAYHQLSPSGAVAAGRGYRMYSNVADNNDQGWSLSRWSGTAWDAIITMAPTFWSVANGTMINDGLIRPATDNTRSLGQSTMRWSVVYAANGTINTSDAREKTPVADLTPAELDAAARIMGKLGSFKWNADVATEGESAALLHFGAHAQVIETEMLAAGLLPARYGMIVHDTWPAQDALIDPTTGAVVSPAVPAGDRYGLLYAELLTMCVRALHARVTELEAIA